MKVKFGCGRLPTSMQPKTKGSGIMVSDLVDQISGFLKLTDDKYDSPKATKPAFPNTATGHQTN